MSDDLNIPSGEQPPKPHFDISAYVVKQLGEELISDEVTALMELVKNSYDADADYVNIVIDTEGHLPGYELNFVDYKGYILIQDNGDGMTADEIVKGWLTISVSKKRDMKQKGEVTGKGRTPLGEKGLGRLSTQRLASKLELFTSNVKEEFGNHVYFNWDDFTEGALLSKINVEIEPVDKVKQRKGTSLILLDLKDPSVWVGDNVQKIKGKLSQLIFPKKRKRPFTVHLSINGSPVDLDYISDNIKDLAVTRYSYSFYQDKLVLLGRIKLAKLKGNDRANFVHLIDVDKGKGFYDFITNPINKKAYISSEIKYGGENDVFIDFKRVISLDDIPGKHFVEIESKAEVENEVIDTAEDYDKAEHFETRKVSVFLNPGNFRAKIDEYNFVRDTVDISSLDDVFKNFTNYTAYVQSQVGVRIFRDGFGIRPFGLDGEDWLKLNQEQTSGSSFYGLRPGNVVGFVEIGANSNPFLLEKTDREGIMDNFFFKNFYLINKRAIKEINDLSERIKRAYNEYRKKYGVESTGLKSQVDVFQLMKKTADDSIKLVASSNLLQQEINQVNRQVQIEIESVEKEPLFAQESSRIQPLLKNVGNQLKNAENLLQNLNSLLLETSKLNNAVHLIEPQIITLQDQLSEFAQLAGLGIVAEALSHEIDNILDTLITQTKTVSQYLKQKSISDANIYVYVEYVNSSIKALRKQASHLSPLLRFIRDEKATLSLVDFATELESFYNDRFAKNRIRFQINVDADFSVSISKGKLTQILDNIVFNSEYWLSEYSKQVDQEQIITIRIAKPIIQIFDNGLGIDPEIADKIFQPFVSAKPKNIGRGLGLFIVHQLLETSGCDIILLPEKNASGRRFIFQINFSNILK